MPVNFNYLLAGHRRKDELPDMVSGTDREEGFLSEVSCAINLIPKEKYRPEDQIKKMPFLVKQI